MLLMSFWPLKDFLWFGPGQFCQKYLFYQFFTLITISCHFFNFTFIWVLSFFLNWAIIAHLLYNTLFLIFCWRRLLLLVSTCLISTFTFSLFLLLISGSGSGATFSLKKLIVWCTWRILSNTTADFLVLFMYRWVLLPLFPDF